MNIEKHTEREWEELGNRFKEIDVDKAWNKVHSRLNEEGLLTQVPGIRKINPMFTFYKIAASLVILLALGAGFLYIYRTVNKGDSITVASAGDERNIEVTLPDGSKVWLNRNSKLTYSPDLGKVARNVKLTGEAFFDITPDPAKPFTIDAGSANIRVVGTSFNVITSNADNKVEVFVKTGKVLLSGTSGDQSIMLEPGYVGTLGSAGTSRSQNENRNYMSWKTDTLVYEGEKLDVVFSDLKKVFDINITSSDPEIINNSLTTTFFSLPEDTIIQVICNTFNLRYVKDGQVYRLSK